ncbi:MAG: hypothetical protein IIZ25_05880 [Thermoguttaceae bacterium]|nr:hypothetical protein [Thermoguttaceae bacterium]
MSRRFPGQNQWTRRTFLRAMAFSACCAPLAMPGRAPAGESIAESIPYESNLRDRLWMWGHGRHSTDGVANIPKGHGIDMADAIRSMGIPNVCVTRWKSLPAPENDTRDGKNPPFDQFIKQFYDTRRVAWSVIDGAGEPYPLKKQWAISLLDRMPNLTTLFLDDFFKGEPKLAPGRTEPDAHLTIAELKALKAELAALPRRPDLAAVLYAYQINDLIREHLEICDVVSLWTWHATDLTALERNFRRYREIMPTKPTLLGIYMWDFGNAKPVTPELMRHQLDVALGLFKEGQIEGMIFHCTPLCDIGLEAVDTARQWIADHAEEQIGARS